MPIYDYRCAGCGPFREMRPMLASHLPQTCPACGEPAERSISAPFLGGCPSAGSTTGGGRSGAAGQGAWRRACGFGCSHAHC
jgi:putative FmdB family regulatory protein